MRCGLFFWRKKMNTQDEKLEYPVRAWTIWLLSAVFMFYKYAIEVSPSVMTGTLMRTFDIGGAELGNLTACYFYAYLLLQIPAGLLLDRFGPRKTTTLAIALCALGMLVFSQTDSLFVAGVGRFLSGVGGAFAAVNCLKLIGNWFPSRQFALMAGLMMTVAMLGAVGGQAPLASFIEMRDWRSAMEIIGFAGLALAALFFLIVRDRAPGRIVAKENSASLMVAVKEIFKNTQSWWLSIYSGLAFAPVMVFGGLWGVSFIQEALKIDQTESAKVLSLIFIGFAVGAPFFGWLSDRLGQRRVVMQWGTVLSLVALTAAIYTPGISIEALSLLLFIFGFSIASFLLCFTMIQEIHLPIVAATAIGFMNMFDALLGAVSDPFTGMCLDLMWDGRLVDGARVFSVSTYQAAFLTLPAYLALSLAALYMIREKEVCVEKI